MSFAQHLFRPGFASFRSRVPPVRLASLSFARTKNLLCSMPCFRAPPHNSAARLAMSFPSSAACKFLDLHPVNLRNLHLHLTKNPFASRPPHLRGVTQTLLLRPGYSIWCALSRKMANSAFRIVFFVLFSFCPFRFPVLTRAEGYGTLFHVETLRLLRKRVVFEGGFPV